MVENFSSVLLAAGRSTRIGRDKALVEFEGLPMWHRQRGVLQQAGASEIFLSVRPEQAWARPAAGFAAHLCDQFPNGGPLVGITAALERASHPHVAVLAIDLRQMRAEWFTMLLGKCVPGVGCVGRRGNFFEPLAAIYPLELKWLAWEAIARGEFSLQGLLSAAVAQSVMHVHEISGKEAGLFENWNEPQ